jgi:hypothetical protein
MWRRMMTIESGRVTQPGVTISPCKLLEITERIWPKNSAPLV